MVKRLLEMLHLLPDPGRLIFAVMPIFTLLVSLRPKRPVFHDCATICCHRPRPGSIMKVEPETMAEKEFPKKLKEFQPFSFLQHLLYDST